MISGADNKHFTFVVNGKQYDTKIAQLPSILETHKTYDGNFLYKSGEIGQIFVVTEKEEEKQLLEQTEELPNGLTPPNTNVLKRKYAKTRRYQPFPKPDVGRVEEDLVKMIQGGPYEEVREELVDFCDWMVDEEHPNGIIVTDEVELIRQHPEYLELSSEPPSKQAKANDARSIPSSHNARSGINTPITTDFGSEVESHGGAESAQRSPALAPTPSPGMSPDADGDATDEKDVDDLEDDLLSGMDEKKPSAAVSTTSQAPVSARATATAPPKKSYLDDPAYHQLTASRDRLQKAVRDAERDANDFANKMNANSNIVVKNRFKQMMETAQRQREESSSELEKVLNRIREMEST
ncbi:hypothetical protein P43SY_005927 [Pythium insidiosum]|uniref:TAFII55 protein conserved region domain-containing protein n=1 Tax=Pythium insidiosum TaxID=114742 RepID=A0AAD5QAW2_PYTIN|nr:hypothetical protein P43SY_005927 [Pythium insidiosum]